jgi:uncharacterized protein YqjF (DUF2071 family)
MTAPTKQQRLEACAKPHDRQAIMFQNWRDLLFLHWQYEPEIIQQSLPRGLTVDTYDGRAYLGVVPFYMRDIRPRFCPSIPGISNFLELNLRTYVYDKFGRPGVWFYSLDANQWLAVRVARSFFNLPYFDAKMIARKESAIDYRVHRKGCSKESESHFRYSEEKQLSTAEPGSLEFFLVERYYLFAVNRAGTLFSGRVHHTPYPLMSVSAEVLSEGVIELAGFERPGRSPDHAIMSPGVDVNIFAIETVD